MTGFSPLALDASSPSSSSSSSQKFAGQASIRGPKWTHLPTLTIGLLGVQIFWSVEMGYASPYLLSLGLSKSSMSLVFLAGPLSGLLMQPLIGVLADTSTSRFGRRRPSMLLGTLICVLAMLLLGHTRAFASLFTTPRSPSNDTLTIALAVLSIYAIDFSINAVMAMDRALLVDTLPPAAQAAANAWAARMLGTGAVVGFFVGSIPLPRLFPPLGTTQLQVLSVVVSVLLFAGHATTAVCVRERVLLKNRDDVSAAAAAKRPNAFVREVRELWSNLRTLPPVIRQICIIQFFAWIAWFPILFYTTIYIGDLYRRSTPLPSPSTSPSTSTSTASTPTRDAEATRLGTRALFFSALLSLALNLLLPFFVATPASRSRSHHPNHPSLSSSRRARFLSPPGRDGGIDEQGHGQGGAGVKIPESLKVNLGSLWAVSHLVLAGCMFGTLLTDSVPGATFLITITGFSWAITQWAPFSLLAEAILTSDDGNGGGGARNSILLADVRTPVGVGVRAGDDGDDDGDGDPEAEVFLRGGRDDRERAPHHDQDHDHDHRDHGTYQDARPGHDSRAHEDRRAPDHAPSSPSSSSSSSASEDENEEDKSLLDADDEEARAHPPRPSHPERPLTHVLGNHHARVSRVELVGEREGEWEDVEDGGGNNGRGKGAGGLSAKAGIILGIHNVFIVIPQFIVTGLSAVIFAIFDPAAAAGSPSPHPHTPVQPHILPPAPVPTSLSSSSLNNNTSTVLLERVARAAMRDLAKDAQEAAERGGQSNSVVYIFRLGGVSALIAFVLCWRLARELRHR